MTRMDTVQVAIERLREQGFTDSFQAEEGGLRALEAGRLVAPEQLVVEDVSRFEGSSDPGDESIVFALRDRETEVRGTWVVSYGSHLDPVNAMCLERLQPRRRRAVRQPSNRRNP
jgi:hypothetical protein